MTKGFNLSVSGAAVALALAAVAGTANAGVSGYVTNVQNQVWTTPFGLCWKTTDWSPAKAAAPCDPVARVSAPVPPPVAAAPAPEPAPLVAAPAPIIEKVALSSDVLFEFDKAQLRPEGRAELDKLAERVKDADIESVQAIGHADRIGPEKYNEKLSRERAESVKQYLAQKGIDDQRVQIEGRGESEPITQNQCKGQRGDALIRCLEPDRRVDIEVRGNRQVAATEAPAGAGTTVPSMDTTSGQPSGSGTGATTAPK
jgi:OmpA-OmpF porin, OOP family